MMDPGIDWCQILVPINNFKETCLFVQSLMIVNAVVCLKPDTHAGGMQYIGGHTVALSGLWRDFLIPIRSVRLNQSL